jgi:Phage integrase, N-terminal SAM-like domain
MSHPDFAVLTVSWELAPRADGYADNTVKAHQNAVRSLAEWLADHHPDVGPTDLDRQHIRGWLVDLRESRSSNTARGWFAGMRHFCRWLQSEGETHRDATAGNRTPAPGDPETAVLSDEDLRALLATLLRLLERYPTAVLLGQASRDDLLVVARASRHRQPGRLADKVGAALAADHFIPGQELVRAVGVLQSDPLDLGP